MQTSPYNNPMFAQGLSSLVQAFTGNPQAEAQSLEAASRARLNNQTAQFRDAIGDTGMSGDLASMMIRSLQAGPEYSRYAPSIGDATIRMGGLGFGGPQHTPRGDIANAIVGSMAPSRGRGRPAGSGGGGSTATAAPRPLTQSAIGRAARLVDKSGYEGTEAASVLDAIIGAYESGQFSTLDQATAEILPGVKREEVQVGEKAGWWGKTTPIMEEQLVLPEFRPAGQEAPTAGTSPTGEVQAMNEARFVLSQGASPKAVFERMVSLGIDPQTARTRMVEMGFDPGES